MLQKKFYRASIILFVFFLSKAEAQTPDQKLIWQIGRLDQSASEFALAPKDYHNFVPRGFGSTNTYYTVGASNPTTDWPYILPGPKDGFAGYGYWSGRALQY